MIEKKKATKKERTGKT